MQYQRLHLGRRRLLAGRKRRKNAGQRDQRRKLRFVFHHGRFPRNAAVSTVEVTEQRRESGFSWNRCSTEVAYEGASCSATANRVAPASLSRSLSRSRPFVCI